MCETDFKSMRNFQKCVRNCRKVLAKLPKNALEITNKKIVRILASICKLYPRIPKTETSIYELIS